MQSLFRPMRLSAAATCRPLRPLPLSSSFIAVSRSSARPYASGSYGGQEQTGHQKSDAPNPKESDEHPGPEAPASKGTNETSSSSSGSSPSNGAEPKINASKTAPEDQSAETREHNEDMRKRPDQSVNQIDDSGKVDKDYWKGNVGPK